MCDIVPGDPTNFQKLIKIIWSHWCWLTQGWRSCVWQRLWTWSCKNSMHIQLRKSLMVKLIQDEVGGKGSTFKSMVKLGDALSWAIEEDLPDSSCHEVQKNFSFIKNLTSGTRIRWHHGAGKNACVLNIVLKRQRNWSRYWEEAQDCNKIARRSPRWKGWFEPKAR